MQHYVKDARSDELAQVSHARRPPDKLRDPSVKIVARLEQFCELSQVVRNCLRSGSTARTRRAAEMAAQVVPATTAGS
jgi:hypothetical protein